MVFLEWPQSTKWFHKSREKMGYIPRTIVEPEDIDPKYAMWDADRKYNCVVLVVELNVARD